MSIAQGLCIVAIAAAVALAPFALAFLFGFGAFVLMPMLMIVLLIIAGALVTRIASRAKWLGVILTTVVISIVYALQLTSGEMGSTICRFPLRAASRILEIFIVAAASCGSLLSLGAWLWSMISSAD